MKSWFLGFLGLGVLAAISSVAVPDVIGETYFTWYLRNGSLIGFISSIVATSWGDINRNTGLISAHPLRYLASCLWLVGLTFYSIGTLLRRSDDPGTVRSPLNILLTIVLMIAVGVLLLLWLVVVVPIQYAVYLVCGAPARLAAESHWRPVARITSDMKLESKEMPLGEQVPEGWWDAGLFSKPVAMTGLIASFVLYVVKAIVIG